MFTLSQFLDFEFAMPDGLTAKFQSFRHAIEQLYYCSQLIDQHKLMATCQKHIDVDADPLTSYNNRVNTQSDRIAVGLLNSAVASAVSCSDLAAAYRTRAHLSYVLDENQACRVNVKLLGSVTAKHDVRSDDKAFAKHVYKMVALQSVENALLQNHRKCDALIGLPADLSAVQSAANRLHFIDAVRLRRSTYGPQTVYTAAPLPAGQLIGVDSAIMEVLDGDASNRRCSHCLAERLLTLVPCKRPGCTAMFCNEPCRRRALNGAHRYECSVTPFLRAHEQCRPVVRLVLDTFRRPADVPAMMSFQRQCTLRTDNAFAYAQQRWSYREANRRLAMALCHKGPIHTIDESFYFARVATVAYTLLKRHTAIITELFEGRRRRKFLRGFIYAAVRMLSDVGYRVHLPSTVRFDGELTVVQPVAHCLFPVTALMRHSCTANAAVMPLSTHRLAVYTVRSIAAGQPLTIDRTYRLPGMPPVSHAHQMRTQLFMDCDCPDEAPPLPSAMLCETDPNMLRMFSDSRASVLELCEEMVAFLQDHVAFLPQPYDELWWARRCMEQCLCRLIQPQLIVDFANDEMAQMRRQSEDKYLEYIWQMMLVNNPTATPATSDRRCRVWRPPQRWPTSHVRSGSILSDKLLRTTACEETLIRLKAELNAIKANANTKSEEEPSRPSTSERLTPQSPNRWPQNGNHRDNPESGFQSESESDCTDSGETD